MKILSENLTKNSHISGEYFCPEGIENSNKKVPLIILSPGYNCSYVICRETINALCQNGIAVFGFDFTGGCNDSKSGGNTAEMSVMTEMAELNTVIDCVKKDELSFINKDEIFLLGESQGGVVTALTAAKRNDISKIILYYPALCLLDDGKKRFKSLSEIPDVIELMDMNIGRKYYEDIWNFDLYEEAAKFDGDVLIIHGTNDSLVPYTSSEKIVKMFSSAMLIPIEGADHGFTGEEVTYAAKCVKDFIESTS